MQTLGQWLRAEPFALAMSSGFFGFFAHAGVLSVLEERGLQPERATGSSAGAMAVGCWSAGVRAADLESLLFSLDRKDFWDPGPGLGLLRGRLFDTLLRDALPTHRFEDCRFPVGISVFEVATRRTVVLEGGDICDAIRASCAVPGFFQPVRIDGRRYLDGGIFDRPGLLGMPGGQRVLFHHLASRSPWRRRGARSMEIPQRPDMATLVVRSLPRVNPFRLERGRQAFAQAREATIRALDAEIREGIVDV